jgi:Holliday junction resolvase RusA-like endonuclease
MEAIREHAGSTRPLPQPPRWRTANAQVTFYAPDRRRRDGDGILASLKATFDGIADAGVIVDDSGFIHHPVLMEHDPANPRVEIRIWLS